MITKEIQELKDEVVTKLEDAKIENIDVIDISEKSSMADYIILATGRSDKHIDSTADTLKVDFKNKYGLEGLKPKGTEVRGWMVLDLGDIIVHLFTEEIRSVYRIEELWKNIRA